MSFTRQSVQELSGLHSEPDWLRARRLEAFEAYERLPLPARNDEEWRRTDIKGLDLTRFDSFERANGGAPGDAIDEVAGVLRQRGSEPGVAELDPELARLGVMFMSLPDAIRQHGELIQRHLFSAVRTDRDKFSALHGALFSGGSFLHVPDGVRITKPLVSQYWSSGGGAAVMPHTLILAGKGSAFNYVDEFLSADSEQPGLASGSAEILADDASEVGYVALQRWGRHAWQFADQVVAARAEARVKVINVGLGSRFSKIRVEAMLQGPGSAAELKALYFGTDNQFFDFHTLQQHTVGQTSSDLLFKGALKDTARAVYAGLIRIEKGAQKSDAYQANRNLLLSKQAKAYSIPMLEILNNEVRCTHGATIAPLDPQHLFYLESRGIPPATAERMIVRGFFGDVLDRIPVAQARELVEQELEERLG